jgi:hypothetical protein
MAASRRGLIKRDIDAVEKAVKDDPNCPFSGEFSLVINAQPTGALQG